MKKDTDFEYFKRHFEDGEELSETQILRLARIEEMQNLLHEEGFSTSEAINNISAKYEVKKETATADYVLLIQIFGLKTQNEREFEAAFISKKFKKLINKLENDSSSKAQTILNATLSNFSKHTALFYPEPQTDEYKNLQVPNTYFSANPQLLGITPLELKEMRPKIAKMFERFGIQDQFKQVFPEEYLELVEKNGIFEEKEE